MHYTKNKNKQMQISIDTANKAHENKNTLSPSISYKKNNLHVNKNDINTRGRVNRIANGRKYKSTPKY